MKKIIQQSFKGERALFQSKDLKLIACTFDDGESPLKESRNIELDNSMMRWKYPLWYCRDILVKDSVFNGGSRAGVWYTDNIKIINTVIDSPKNFRRCKNVELMNVTIPDAKETFWSCIGVKLDTVSVNGDYFCMNSEKIEADNLRLSGNYSFDGAKDLVLKNSVLVTKDAFWNSENVRVENSWISGEYLGWNSKNLYFENCTIESLQGLCYIDNLVMRNCRFIDTTLAFEYSNVDVEAVGNIGSVFNPSSGRIKCDSISELIIEEGRVESFKTAIECDNIGARLDKPEWIK